ncbi:MAG: hypothetical protein ACM3QS_14495 [Bacteroidota bacterium]
MNLRCAFCQTPYALGRTEMLAALQTMERENLTHYDAHCPRCRRVTQIPRQKLELAFPNWREALKEAVEQASAAQEAKPEPAAKAAAPASDQPAGKKAASPKSSAKAPAKKAAAQKTGKK